MHKFQFSSGHAFLPHLRENFGREDGKIVDVLLEKFIQIPFILRIVLFQVKLDINLDNRKKCKLNLACIFRNF